MIPIRSVLVPSGVGLGALRAGSCTLAAAAVLGCAPAPPPTTQAVNGGAAQVVAITNVNVLPMDRERLLERQTVLIRDGWIEEVGPAATVSVPAGATVIEASGKFLMPGLAEMHAHIPDEQAPRELMETLMFLYVANGVTTIRGMLGAPNQLELREATARGEVLGPTIFVSAPSLNGNSAPDPATAERLVRAHQQAGYDFLKLHPGLSRAVYDAIVATAREVGITWAGHVSADVGLEHTIETGQSTIDHLDGYLQAVASEPVRQRLATGNASLGEVVRSVEPQRVRAMAAATRAAGIWNVPTMYLWENFSSPAAPEELVRLPEMRYATPAMRNGWVEQKRAIMQNQRNAGVTDEDGRLHIERRREILKALADAGAPLMLGSDSPQMFNVPGFSIHHEMRVMAESGLTPYAILESGTRNIARYAAEELQADARFGTIAAGNRADLLLLDANPLEDVANVARRAGVMVRGAWLPESEIRRRLEQIAARNAD